MPICPQQDKDGDTCRVGFSSSSCLCGHQAGPGPCPQAPPRSSGHGETRGDAGRQVGVAGIGGSLRPLGGHATPWSRLWPCLMTTNSPREAHRALPSVTSLLAAHPCPEPRTSLALGSSSVQGRDLVWLPTCPPCPDPHDLLGGTQPEHMWGRDSSRLLQADHFAFT